MHQPTPTVSPNETLYEFTTRIARGASNRALQTALVAGLTLGTLLAVLNVSLWPFTAACATVCCVATWGLLEHQRHATDDAVAPVDAWSQRWLTVLERILVVVGCLFACVAAMGTMYLFFGKSWIS